MGALSLALVVVGASLLVLSLRPAWRISRSTGARRVEWTLLLAMIVGFLVGYVVYVVQLLVAPATATHLLVAFILCGGGLFVWTVTRGSLRTIQSIVRAAAEERHRSAHDPVTGLANRALAQERIDYSLLLARRESAPVAVLLLDLNRFKDVNDALGHESGDALLKQVGARLQSHVRASDTVARLGGDEFAVILPGADAAQAFVLAEKISATIEEPFVIDDRAVSLSVAVGAAVYPLHGTDASTLLRRADVAMYAAKRGDSDQGMCVVYQAEQDASILRNLELITALRRAIKSEEFVLHYQPQIHLKTGRVCAVEALVRWHPPGGDVITPGEFIPLAEQTGLITGITRWVVERALRDNHDWRARGHSVPVAINISAKDLRDPRFPAFLADALARWRVPPADVILEITESSMMGDPARSRPALAALSALGVQMSVDDFGTGYSSLAQLKQLPAVEIKIDRSFVCDMMTDDNDAVIVRSIVDLAHNIGRRVVAEGVESQDIVDVLAIVGCDIVQGFHIARPMDSSALLTRWLPRANDDTRVADARAAAPAVQRKLTARGA